MKQNSHKWFKRIMVAFGAIIALFGLSGCTNSFCTNQDKANQLYAYYGDVFNNSTKVDEVDSENENETLQNTNRTTLYNTLSTSYGYSLPDKKFQAYMSDKVDAFVDAKYTLWLDGQGSLGSLTETEAKRVARNVGMFAGIENDTAGNPKVAKLWTNYDAWYQDALADSSVGVLYAPSAGFVSVFKSTLETTVNNNDACITPVTEDFKQNGSTIYIEGKTWGQAFQQFGFLEGLFVYPFAYIVHVISESFGDQGWAQILAILVVTLLARIITVISTLVQGRTQSKQNALKPQLDALSRKYPNSSYDRDQKQAMAMEQAQLMKKAKVHPLLPMLFMIIQFPLFICVWSALQGSAALASGSLFGLSLTTLVSTCVTSYATTPGALVGILVFIMMTIANILTSLTGLWMNKWRTDNFGAATVTQKDANGNIVDPNKTMKWMTYIMMAFVVFMGWSLPVAMGIYWFFGSVISICQTLLTEGIQTRSRHKKTANTGDGSDLAALRRSSHHNGKKR